RTVAGSPDPGALAAAGRADAVAFTSSSTVERTVSLLGLDRIPPVVASIGPVTSASALAAGLSVTVEATEHTIDGLVAALVVALGEGGAASG
ncbi:MAG: uroporphyrinogen-III synthase, partial [Acidimicrobiales bacterium]